MRYSLFLLIGTGLILSCGKATIDPKDPATYIDMKFTNDTNDLLDPFVINSGSALWDRDDSSGYQVAIHYFPIFTNPEEPHYNVNIHFYLTPQQHKSLNSPDHKDCILIFCNEINSNVYITYLRPQQVPLLFEGETINTTLCISKANAGVGHPLQFSGTIRGPVVSEDGSVALDTEASFNYIAQ